MPIHIPTRAQDMLGYVIWQEVPERIAGTRPAKRTRGLKIARPNFNFRGLQPRACVAPGRAILVWYRDRTTSPLFPISVFRVPEKGKPGREERKDRRFCVLNHHIIIIHSQAPLTAPFLLSAEPLPSWVQIPACPVVDSHMSRGFLQDFTLAGSASV